MYLYIELPSGTLHQLFSFYIKQHIFTPDLVKEKQKEAIINNIRYSYISFYHDGTFKMEQYLVISST